MTIDWTAMRTIVAMLCVVALLSVRWFATGEVEPGLVHAALVAVAALAGIEIATKHSDNNNNG